MSQLIMGQVKRELASRLTISGTVGLEDVGDIKVFCKDTRRIEERGVVGGEMAAGRQRCPLVKP